MPSLDAVELYCAEARQLVARAEAIVERLNRNGACEGHRLMASQGLAAIRRLDHIIDGNRKRLASDGPHPILDEALPAKRRWWPMIRRRAGDDAVHA